MFFRVTGSLKIRNKPIIEKEDISAATKGWNFAPNFSDFPNAHLSISSIQATGYALKRNVFRLYHPKTFNPHNSTTWDLSEPFMADHKQLAIGVGVGVGVTWFVAFLVAWYTSAWYQKRVLEKNGFVLSLARLD
ncbi:hypothetical protein E8E11_011047 [Didymella keratinophila]|nr:hypothetical protein E8E11_011047 [Didymella keratinophila]